ncbi:MAG: hypothetical protein IJG63_09270, partial [Oscillospiraceae bacterium]|nr:hypothetical protein [Oscillospiraceae bacterium]
MKKIIALLLCLLLLTAALSGCGTKQEPAAEPETAPAPEPVPSPAPEKEEGPYSPDGSIIFEKDGLKVTTAGT